MYFYIGFLNLYNSLLLGLNSQSGGLFLTKLVILGQNNPQKSKSYAWLSVT